MRDYMKIYRCMVVILFVVQALSSCLYAAGKISTSDGMLKEYINKQFKECMIEECNLSSDIHCEKLKNLIKQGADVNATNDDGETLLHSAAYFNNIRLMQILIENNANVNLKTKSGETPLHSAAANGHCNAMRLLIDNCADIDITSYFDESSLHWAAKSGHCAAIELLIKKGADRTLINTWKQTPHQYILSKLTGQDIAVQGSRLAGIEDENERIAAMQEIAHDKKATERERLEVCAYMLEHPDRINKIFPIIAMKSARKRLE